MRFQCVCGEVIRDQSDLLPHKGYLRSDEDDFALTDAFEALAASVAAGVPAADVHVSEVTLRFERQVFECVGCGRLYVETERSPSFGVRFTSYLPEGDERGVLRSVLRARASKTGTR